MKATRDGWARCTFPDCGRPNASRGLCSGHRAQRDKGQELRPIRPQRTGCSVEECDRRHESLGFCGMHYRRFKLYGDPHAMLRIKDARERFDLYYDKDPSGCWLWNGSLTYDGYGLFRENNRVTGAHRFAYEYFVGPIPEGLQIDHMCRVRNCVNPDHLDPVTVAENTIRAFEAAKRSHEDYIRWVEERQAKVGA